MPIDVVKLGPKQESWGKTEPIQSAELPDSKKFRVLGNLPLNVLADYSANENGHYLVTASGGTPSVGKSFYIYQGHFDNVPQVLHVNGTSKIQRDDGRTAEIPKGSRLALSLVSQADIANGDNFTDLVFVQPYEGHTAWKIFHGELAAKCSIEGTSDDNHPKGVAGDVVPAATATAVSVPEFTCPISNTRKRQVILEAPILRNGNFTWNEALHGGSRIPVSESVLKNIIQIAKVLEEVRQKLGDRAITVNSWYRDPATNKRVGGASRSRHLVGDAVDFVVPGIHPYQVYKSLNGWWGNRGGLASATVFTHIDARGHGSRWQYNF